jgi:hypothetical protein
MFAMDVQQLNKVLSEMAAMDVQQLNRNLSKMAACYDGNNKSDVLYLENAETWDFYFFLKPIDDQFCGTILTWREGNEILSSNCFFISRTVFKLEDDIDKLAFIHKGLTSMVCTKIFHRLKFELRERLMPGI